MSEVPASAGKRRLSPLLGALLLAALAVVGAIYFMAGEERKPLTPEAPGSNAPQTAGTNVPQDKVTRALATGSLTAFVVHPKRPALAELAFTEASGKQRSLSEWRGRVVLVNLWATWCAPCRKEMPSLAELERQLGSKDFEVVAISLDRKGAEAAAPFLKDTGAAGLALYLDATAASLDQLRAIGLPASVLVDRQGNEIGRMLGPADWSSPEAIALVKAALAEKTG
ncbi:MAG: TlpA disulfide reductase family protein [Hyphomicrobiales bacterium]